MKTFVTIDHGKERAYALARAIRDVVGVGSIVESREEAGGAELYWVYALRGADQHLEVRIRYFADGFIAGYRARGGKG